MLRPHTASRSRGLIFVMLYACHIYGRVPQAPEDDDEKNDEA
ncbi:hypothetical protein [Pontibacter russatus]|nr:hypothetical protein [Pontibacter russatus]